MKGKRSNCSRTFSRPRKKRYDLRAHRERAAAGKVVRVKILVIGDAMRDEYWTGFARRLSPVAPVPVISVTHREERPGAAANVAANIEAMGVPCERIYGGGERIRKITVTAGQHVVRLDFDAPQRAIEPDAAFMEALGRCDLVVALDYGKGSLANIAALIQADKGKPFLIDPKGHDYAKYRGAALLKPNRDEMRELVGGWGSREEMDYKARQFLHQSGVGSILLTQAADGMTLYTRTDTLHQEAENRAPVDVSGAGEAALSAYAAALARGYIATACFLYANKAAGIAITRHGTTVCTQEEVFGTG